MRLPDEIRQSGFINTYELWYTLRARNVIAYRGCDVSETQDGFGYSWSLSIDITTFFALSGLKENPVVITARFTKIDAWLDTAEHEIICINNFDEPIQIERLGLSQTQKIDWENRPTKRKVSGGAFL